MTELEHAATTAPTEDCAQFTRDLRLLLKEDYAEGSMDPIKRRMRTHAETCPHCKALVGEIKDQAEHPDKATNKGEAEGYGEVALEAFAFIGELIVDSGDSLAEAGAAILEGLGELLGGL